MPRPARSAVSLSPRALPVAHFQAGGGRLVAFSPASATHNLPALVDDAREAALRSDPGPQEPSNYHALRGRLEAARESLPHVYIDEFYQPFVAVLNRLGPIGFSQVLQRDPARESTAGLLFDVAQAILQNAEGYESVATDAFQEVVSDLFDGFLSAEDRRGVEPPDRGALAPLVKWGNPDFGPYTWPVDATADAFRMGAGVVSLPPAHAHQGLLAWAALPHEAAGHDILHADTGLLPELASAVYARLKKDNLQSLAAYWADRIDETASDVLGILNMGPAAGIGLIGYFRGLNAAWNGTPTLRSHGPADDPHPADLLRGYLAAAVVQGLEFAGSKDWAKLIERETEADRADVVIAGAPVRIEAARVSAGLVAEVLVTHGAAALEGHALGQIQNWRDADEARVAQMSQLLLSAPGELPRELGAQTYAAHVVAAAVVASLTAGAPVRQIHARMIQLLKQMHDTNPSWGPLFVRYRGNLVPHRAYRAWRNIP